MNQGNQTECRNVDSVLLLVSKFKKLSLYFAVEGLSIKILEAII